MNAKIEQLANFLSVAAVHSVIEDCAKISEVAGSQVPLDPLYQLPREAHLFSPHATPSS